MKLRGTNRWSSNALICIFSISVALSAEPELVGIRLRVVDSITEVPVSGALAFLRKSDAPFEKLGHFTDGVFAFSRPATTQAVELRVQSEDYTTLDVSLSLTNSRIEKVVKLDRKIPFRGFVLAPTGQTAENAEVVLLQKKKRFVFIQSNRKVETFNEFKTDDTDSHGRFSIGPGEDGESVLIVHELGVAEIPLIGWTNETKILLRPWTAAKGRMLINNEPAVNQNVVAGMVKFPTTSKAIQLQQFETQTDLAGFFFFDQLPPGEITLQWMVPVGAQSFTYSHGVNFMVDSTLSNELRYYLRGRVVRGEAITSDDFDWNAQLVFAHISAPPEPPSEFSPLGVSAFPNSFSAILSEKGKFEAAAVPPGKYILRLQAQKQDNTMDFIEGTISVPEGNGPINLGKITLKKMKW